MSTAVALPSSPVQGVVARWVRGLLAGLLLVETAGAAATTALPGDLPTLVARAQRGQVRVLQLQRGSAEGGLHLHLGAQDDRRRLLWLDPHGVRHAADLPRYGPLTTSGAAGQGLGAVADELATVVAAAPPDARPRVLSSGASLRERLAALGTLTLLVLLVLLAVGPQPRRATTWAWAWALLLRPAGVGGLLHLWREAPWSARTGSEPAPVDPRAVEPGVRTGGGTAFVLLLTLGVLRSGLGGLLAAALPSSGHRTPARYEVVHVDGSRSPGVLAG